MHVMLYNPSLETEPLLGMIKSLAALRLVVRYLIAELRWIYEMVRTWLLRIGKIVNQLGGIDQDQLTANREQASDKWWAFRLL